VSSLTVIALIGTVLFAVSTSSSGLMLGRALIGMGFAGVISGILLLTMGWVPADRFSTVAAIVIAVAGGFGGIMATAPLVLVLRGLGWTATFLALAAATGLVGLAIFVMVRDAPAGAPAPPERARESLRESLRGLWAIASQPDYRRMLAMAFCIILPFSSIGGLWAGPYLRDSHGLTQQELSYVLLGMIVALHIGTLVYGPLDRLFNTRKAVVLGGAGIMTLAIVALALLPAGRLWAAVGLLHLIAISSPFYVTLAAHCRGFVPPDRAGRAITMMNLFGLSGAFISQWITGLIVELFSAADGTGSELAYRLVFGFVAALVAGASMLYLRAPDVPPRPVEHRD
jgi:predicted MFS family arabinose efflux permease